jgi:hypothetical protein
MVRLGKKLDLKLKRTKITCIASDAFLLVLLTKSWFYKLISSFLLFFPKLKNTKNHFFVSGTTGNAPKVMHVSFVH